MTDAATAAPTSDPEQLVAEWRARMVARPGVAADDVDELEDHLRGHLSALTALGLTPEESFLVAVRRVGAQHTIAADLAREHAGRLWKQHVGFEHQRAGTTPAGVLTMLGFAVLAGLAVKIPFGDALRDLSGAPSSLRHGSLMGKRGVVENMAPVLSMVFTPLFTLLLLAFLGALITTRHLVDLDRGVLMVMNLVLVVVLGLHLFSGPAGAGCRRRRPGHR